MKIKTFAIAQLFFYLIFSFNVVILKTPVMDYIVLGGFAVITMMIARHGKIKTSYTSTAILQAIMLNIAVVYVVLIAIGTPATKAILIMTYSLIFAFFLIREPKEKEL